MSYSPELTYFLDKLNGFSTNIFRLEPQGSNTASPNSIIRVSLPTNAILNTRSFAFHFGATTSGGGARLPAKIDTLIDRVEVACGSVQLSSGSNYYNVLRHAKDALMGTKTDVVLGHDAIVRTKSYVDDSSITGTDAEDYGVTKANFCIDHFEGFLGSCEPALLDVANLPDIVISIYLAGNEVLTSSAGVALEGTGALDFTDTGANNASYSLNNIHFTIEAVGLSDGIFDNMVQGMIAQKGFLEIPFKQYVAFEDTHGGAMRFSVSTQSLDRIWAVHRGATPGTQGPPIRVEGYANSTGASTYDTHGVFDCNKERYVGAYYNFPEPSATSLYQFQLNGAYYPQHKGTFEEMYAISRNSVLGKTQDKVPLHTVRNNFAVNCIRLNLPNSELSRTISGLNTSGISLNGYYNITNLPAINKPVVNIFCELTSSLKIGMGRQVEVIS